jgi:spectrin beta
LVRKVRVRHCSSLNHRRLVNFLNAVSAGDLEAHLFSIQTKLFSKARPVYHPPDGLLISDINGAWSMLESVEHKREMALRDQLIRLEKVEQLARKFERKAELREAWIAENLEVIASDGPGDSLSTVSAALKRRGAIATDVAAHELRISGLHAIGDELLRLDYHGVSLIRKRKNGVEAQWVELKAQLDDHRANLERTQELFTIFKDMERAE